MADFSLHANYDGHISYHRAELFGPRPNSLGSVASQVYHWSGRIRAILAQLDK